MSSAQSVRETLVGAVGAQLTVRSFQEAPKFKDSSKVRTYFFFGGHNRKGWGRVRRLGKMWGVNVR
eukprot:24353-Amorphochlora_amoeboformis.AAC.1